MHGQRGYFLVASPHLPDSNFCRTVVLMVQHDEEGALGLVLNRPTDKTVGQLWEKVTEIPCSCPRAVYRGGPVDGPLMALHTNAAWADDEILPGVYFASTDTYLEEIVQQSEQPFRFFLGYAGWAAGQLESELKVGGWLRTEANCQDVFDEDEELWKKVSSRIGLEILGGAVSPEIFPDDPSVN